MSDTKILLTQILEEDHEGASDSFKSLMIEQIKSSLESKRIEVASTRFNESKLEEEEETCSDSNKE